MAPHIDVSPQKSSQHSSQRLDPPPANIIPIDKRAGDLAYRISVAYGISVQVANESLDWNSYIRVKPK